MAEFRRAIDQLLDHEGERLIVNDKGRGASKWGVTLATARELHPAWTAADIAALDRAGAAKFYRTWFWDRYKLGRIEDQGVANKLFDLGANLGRGTAIKLLQRAAGVRADGSIGPETLGAVNSQDPAALLSRIRCLAEARYRKLAIEQPERFAECLEGWLARLAT